MDEKRLKEIERQFDSAVPPRADAALVRKLIAEVRRLTRWKAEAEQVLEHWNNALQADPGAQLGDYGPTRYRQAADEVCRLRLCSCVGLDPTCPTHGPNPPG